MDKLFVLVIIFCAVFMVAQNVGKWGKATFASFKAKKALSQASAVIAAPAVEVGKKSDEEWDRLCAIPAYVRRMATAKVQITGLEPLPLKKKGRKAKKDQPIVKITTFQELSDLFMPPLESLQPSPMSMMEPTFEVLA